jgi:hypothetical protein
MKQVCYKGMPLPWMFLPGFGLIFFPKLDQMDDIYKLDKIDDIMKQNLNMKVEHMEESRFY